MRIAGEKGKRFSDRQLAGDVRNLALKQLQRVLTKIDKNYTEMEKGYPHKMMYKGKITTCDVIVGELSSMQGFRCMYCEGTILNDFEKDVLLRLSPSLLPKLQEVSGIDGGAIQIEGVDISIRKE